MEETAGSVPGARYSLALWGLYGAWLVELGSLLSAWLRSLSTDDVLQGYPSCIFG